MTIMTLDQFMQQALLWANVMAADSWDDPQEEERLGVIAEEAETGLLSQPPLTTVHVIVQLELICEGLIDGQRSDRLDVKAVRSIQQQLLKTVAPLQPALNQFIALRVQATQERSHPLRTPELHLVGLGAASA